MDFAKDVLPILSDRCYACHGPDGAGRQAGLRLDLKEHAFADRDGFPALVPGDLEASELAARIRSEFPEEQMPPPDSNYALSEEEVQLLERWIQEGARWDEHWAFVPPARPTPPFLPPGADSPGTGSRGAIDRFVLAALERDGIAPAPEADPGALLRRVTLDLTGLPPTPEALEAYLESPWDDRFERAVDRLLASPAYGERMAWEWLDAARYSDTDGYQADPTRSMWPWRDWLVDAINRNVPFDQLTVELLAGDLLPDATPEQVLASAFNRNHMYNGEGGRIAEETRTENVFDRVETTTTTWLGLTVGCARCHDHRYDPISQREYFQLYDFFNQTSESGAIQGGRAAPTLPYLDAADRARLEAIAAETAELEAARLAPDPELDAAEARWLAAWRDRMEQDPALTEASALGTWRTSGPYLPGAEGPGSLFAGAFAPEPGAPAEAAPAEYTDAPELVDGQVHESTPQVAAMYFRREITAPTARRVELSLGSDDAIKVWVNGAEVLAKNVARGAEPDQERVTVDLTAGANDLLVKIVNTGGRSGIYFKLLGEEVEGLDLGLLAASASEIRARFRAEHDPDWAVGSERLGTLEAEAAGLRGAALPVMVMDQLPAERQRTTRLLRRGSYLEPMEDVAADTPAFLPPFPSSAPRDRLGLARWIVDPANPLTARVAVNRAWQTLMGRGLVASPGDFGRQSAAPTHPELLDWLATEFVRSGWDVKHLHRLIVSSSAYRRSASATGTGFQDDPHNERLARASRTRLPSWMLRDQALALAGLLEPELGGVPVRPYQPDGVWAEATFGTIRYRQDEGAALYRRSLYVFWRRIVRPTFFFDTSKRQVCEVGRTVTNTPLHALTTLNETGYVEAARCFAARVLAPVPTAPPGELAHGGDASISDEEARASVRRAFRAATAREPDAAELGVLLERFRAEQVHFAFHLGDAAELVAAGAAPAAEGLPVDVHAAMTVVCSILLNLDEVLCRP